MSAVHLSCKKFRDSENISCDMCNYEILRLGSV